MRENIIYVTSCSKVKTGIKKGTPSQLYSGWRIKSFFNRFPSPRAILSHKHGIVLETEIVNNYDFTEFVNIEELAKKVNKVVGDRFVIFYSPRELTEKQWIDFLDLSGVVYCVMRSYKHLNAYQNTLDDFFGGN